MKKIVFVVLILFVMLYPLPYINNYVGSLIIIFCGVLYMMYCIQCDETTGWEELYRFGKKEQKRLRKAITVLQENPVIVYNRDLPSVHPMVDYFKYQYGFVEEDVKFINEWYHYGESMSQNDLAALFGCSRSKVRRTASKINKVAGQEIISWRKITLCKKIEERPVFDFNLTEFEGLRIPKNWFKNFDNVKNELINGRGHTCGFELKMDCRRITNCLGCICWEENRDIAMRLVAKIEKTCENVGKLELLSCSVNGVLQ